MSKSQIIGHRGCREEHATENTISAFQCAIDNQLDAIEMDLQLTKDGHIVIHHDEDLMRIYGISANISSHTLSELKTLTKNHPHPIVSLDDALSFLAGFPCILEIKSEGIAEILDKVIDHSKNTVLAVISFHKKYLKTYKKFGGKYTIGFLPNKKNFWYSPFLTSTIKADILAVHDGARFFSLTIYLAKILRLKLFFYPVNDKKTYKTLTKLYRPNYVCTDYSSTTEKIIN